MVNKRLDIQSLQNVREFVTKKDTLETLKAINDNLIDQQQQSKKSKSVDVNLVGWTNGEDIIGKEPKQRSKKQNKEESEFDKKTAEINELKDAGLIIEGQHTPLKSKQGEPDVYDEPIRKFRVTNEGSSLLDLAEQLGLVKNVKKSKDLADEVNDNNPDAASEVGNIRTKSDQKREDKESKIAVEKTIANSKSKAT